MIICIIGQPGSGKTTIATALKKVVDNYLLNIRGYKEPCEHIDGDKFREIFGTFDYTVFGRMENMTRLSIVAAYQSCSKKYAPVIVSSCFPYKDYRNNLNDLKQPVLWVYLTYDSATHKRRNTEYMISDFQAPIEDEEKFIHLNTSELTVEQCVQEICDAYRTVADAP